MPKPAALFLHGAGGGAWEWRVWQELWRAHGLHVRALDFQPAEEGLEATALSDYQHQVDAALAALPRPRVLVGASLGGLLAACAAQQADALVVINPIPPAPWHAGLPARDWPARVPWRQQARLASTQAALPLADAASTLFAFRRWRDESGAVMRQAQAGVACATPACPTLVLASDEDEDVPPAVSRALAQAWSADVMGVAGGHVDAVLGRVAADCARLAVEWLNQHAPAA